MAQRTVKPSSPMGCSFLTSTESTRACSGPTRTKSRAKSTEALGALEDRFDPAVVQVADPAVHAELGGAQRGRLPEPDTLHATADQRPHPYPLRVHQPTSHG